MPEKKPYGTWKSRITPEFIARGFRLAEVGYDDQSDTLCWLEGRGKRGVIVCQSGDQKFDLPYEFGVKGKVGYGGGDFTVSGGTVFFCCGKTGRLMRQPIAPDSQAQAVTPTGGFCSSPRVSGDGQTVIYVHHDPNSRLDCIAIVDAFGKKWPQKIAEGHDFYSHPRLGPNADQIAFVAWDHPHMPWEHSHVYTLDIRGESSKEVCVSSELAGSCFQPEYRGDDLVFVADHSGFNELYLFDSRKSATRQITNLKKDLGMPNWVQDMRQYALLNSDEAVCAVNDRGQMQLARIGLSTGEVSPLGEASAFGDITQVVAKENRVAFLGSSTSTPLQVIDFDTDKKILTSRAQTVSNEIEASEYSIPEVVEWQTTEGGTSFGLFYKPFNSRYESDGKPPLICFVHGGPTAQVRAGFDLRSQAFSSRGYAVLQVNHRGSSGFGRSYMQGLNGKWGIYDVDDVVTGAKELALRGLVDLDRVVVMGGSAGGYTTLQAVVRYPDFFAAGVSLYGIANLFTLAEDTHKFEERYLDSLIGPLPESEEIYRERSPIFQADKIKTPMAIYQGEEDQVVPKAQAEQIVDALKRNQVPHIFHIYDGEGHGFRKPETLEHFYTSVDGFLRQHVL